MDITIHPVNSERDKKLSVLTHNKVRDSQMTVLSQHLHLGLLGTLVILSVVIVYYDARYFRIPNSATFLLAAVGLIWAVEPLGQSLITAIANGVAGLAVLAAVRWLYTALRNRTGLGLGDVKLAGAACIWIGILQLPWLILVACIVAFIHICMLYITPGSGVQLATKLPFGAHLAVALCFIVLAGGLFDSSALP